MADRPLNPLPYYKWYWQDFRANRTVQRMSYVERGLYRELLDECWAEGGIPTDMESIADICGCPVEVMTSAWQVLGKCFRLMDGRFYNEKLHSVRTAKDAERVFKADAGKAGGIAKSLKRNEPDSTSQASAKQVLGSCHIEEKRREEKSKGENKKHNGAVAPVAGAPKKSPKGKQVEWVSSSHMIATCEGLTEPVAVGYLEFRRSKKAALTELAWKSIASEVVKTGMAPDAALSYAMNRGWKGFDAKWLTNDRGGVKQSRHDLSGMDYKKGVDEDGNF